MEKASSSKREKSRLENNRQEEKRQQPAYPSIGVRQLSELFETK